MIVGGRKNQLHPKTMEWVRETAEKYNVSVELVEDAYRYAHRGTHTPAKKKAAIEFIEKKVLGWR